MSILFLNILTLLAPTQSADNLHNVEPDGYYYGYFATIMDTSTTKLHCN